ncbi:MAG TPA: electron transfer flavoprotein subunit alpha/FixB family protein [Terriglobia bacterium]|nr:electron transfer flavoprotein subunit alpha/FixB family protein [Terriglobia bacterium]
MTTGKILVVAEHQDGRIARATWEALAAGQKLAHDTGGTLSAAILGDGVSGLASELAATEVEEVLIAESPALKEYTADGYSLALQSILKDRPAQYVVFGHTYQVRDFAPKLAAALGGGFISDCLGYQVEDGRCIFTRQVFQGKFNADVEPDGEPPWLISFQAGAFRQDAVQRGAAAAKITPLTVDVPAANVRTQPSERFREAKQSVDLTQAEIIVAAGRGIKGPENLELVQKLAKALGGEVGASRPICDNEWLPMDRQIGSSGQTVAPKLYVALGISGAIQHQVGMKGSRTIVAVNRDPEAPIFEIATYGIVGDLFEIVPLLIEEIQRRKAES